MDLNVESIDFYCNQSSDYEQCLDVLSHLLLIKLICLGTHNTLALRG